MAAAAQPKPKSIYQRLSLRELKARPTAGMESDAPQGEGKYRSSDAIIGFSGYLPGLQNTIGCSFPTLTKMSRSYVDQQQAILEKSPKRLTGQKAVPVLVPDGLDRWGNVKMPNTLGKKLAAEYLGALGTAPLDVAAASPPKEAPGILSKPSSAPRPGMPKHVLGYTGYRKGASDHFGEPFSRVEAQVVGLKGGTYEQVNHSPTAVRHA